MDDTECRIEELPDAINDRQAWMKPVMESRASSTWWWLCGSLCPGEYLGYQQPVRAPDKMLGGKGGGEGNLCGWVSHPGECKCLLAFSSYRTRVNSSRMDHMADERWLDLFIQPGKILGCHVNRAQEDLFRLEFDKEVRNMRPTVSPSLCRYSTVTLFQDYSQGTLKLLLSSIILFHPQGWEVSFKESLEWSVSNFSSQYSYIVQQKGYEKEDNHQHRTLFD